MPIQIRETNVVPDAGGDVVRLHISDAPPDDPSATFAMSLTVKVGAYDYPLLAHLQRAAMSRATDALTKLLQATASGIADSGQGLEPRPKR